MVAIAGWLATGCASLFERFAAIEYPDGVFSALTADGTALVEYALLIGFGGFLVARFDLFETGFFLVFTHKIGFRLWLPF